MTTETDPLQLWRSVERTDPAATKNFSGKGGFKGTAISPMWLIRRATELWGPMGGQWGIRITNQQVIPGAPILSAKGEVIGQESLHVVLAEVFYPGGSIPCFGQTILVGQNKHGPFTDEEAPKKSLTDALTKGLSWLGFAADVHMGRFDDVKYRNYINAEFRQAEPINPEQISQLNDLILNTHTELSEFLDWAEVESLDQLPAVKFQPAIAIFRRKQNQNGVK